MYISKKLREWVDECEKLCKPENVHWCTGSEEEFKQMANIMIERGQMIKLNEQKRPNSYYAKSDPSDVARVEDRTFICSKNELMQVRRITGWIRLK